jgi:hypothetical protein
MRDDDPLQRTIKDWEGLFTKASFLRPVGHGDTSPFSRDVQGWRYSPIQVYVRLEAYANMVSAVLNRWAEIKMVCSEPYMSDPIFQVASMAFLRKDQTDPRSEEVLCEPLRPQLERLWTESPRPHDESLRFLALNFGQYFPISRVEAWLLFQQPGWAIVATRIASDKGWLNDALAMMHDIDDRKVDLDAWVIQDFVKRGFPKLKAIRWLLRFHETKESVNMLRVRWEAELIAEGMTQAEVYGNKE